MTTHALLSSRQNSTAVSLPVGVFFITGQLRASYLLAETTWAVLMCWLQPLIKSNHMLSTSFNFTSIHSTAELIACCCAAGRVLLAGCIWNWINDLSKQTYVQNLGLSTDAAWHCDHKRPNSWLPAQSLFLVSGKKRLWFYF